MKRFVLPLLCASLGAGATWAAPARAADKQTCIAAAESGQRLRKDHKLVLAREQLLVCSAQECPPLVSGDCTQWLGEVERSLASVVVRPRDPDGHEIAEVKVIADGQVRVEGSTRTPVVLDPGAHSFRYESPGFSPVTEQVELREGERNRVLAPVLQPVPSSPAPAGPVNGSTAPPEPQPSSGGIPVAAWAIGGVGVVALGSFAYFGISGHSDQNNLEQGPGKCAPNCTDAQVSPIRTKFIVADVSLAVGVVALGVATYLIFTHGSKHVDAQGIARLGTVTF